jgi:hypothetical protein
MRGWNKLIFLGALLSVMLIISVVFSSGVVDVLTLSPESSPESSPLSSSTPEVFVDPSAIIKDYVNDPGYQIGNTFEVYVNVTDATDLFAWQINMSWDTSMLNVSSIIADEFLNRTNPTANTTSHELGFVINVTDNAMGYTAMGESILGGDTGVNGSGRLITIEFQVVGYGCTELTIISAGGDLPTTLLNSTTDSMAFTITVGYFRNKLQGDTDANQVVDGADISVVIYHRDAGGPGGYDRNVDIDDNTAIDGADISLVIANRGRHT